MYTFPSEIQATLHSLGFESSGRRWVRRAIMPVLLHLERARTGGVDVVAFFGGPDSASESPDSWAVMQYSQANQAHVRGGYYDESDRGYAALERDFLLTERLLDLSSTPDAVCAALLQGTLCPGLTMETGGVTALRDALSLAQAYHLEAREADVLTVARALARDPAWSDKVSFWLSTRGLAL